MLRVYCASPAAVIGLSQVCMCDAIASCVQTPPAACDTSHYAELPLGCMRCSKASIVICYMVGLPGPCCRQHSRDSSRILQYCHGQRPAGFARLFIFALILLSPCPAAEVHPGLQRTACGQAVRADTPLHRRHRGLCVAGVCDGHVPAHDAADDQVLWQEEPAPQVAAAPRPHQRLCCRHHRGCGGKAAGQGHQDRGAHPCR